MIYKAFIVNYSKMWIITIIIIITTTVIIIIIIIIFSTLQNLLVTHAPKKENKFYFRKHDWRI